MTIILGIDPGSRTTGYGVIGVVNQQLSYMDSGCIRTGDGVFSDRLLQIFNGICMLMECHQPQQVAIESIFMHENASSALKLGHARGVAMVACATHRLPIAEYAAREVKQALVGYGAATKPQVKHMVMQLLSLPKPPQSDAADALAIAICHHHMQNGLFLKPRRKNSRSRYDWLVER